jgi:outer membrane protein
MRKVLGCLLIVFFSYPLVVQAAELKIGYVDLQRALNESEPGKKARAAFQTDLERMEQRLQKRKEDLEKLGQELEKKVLLLRDEERDSMGRDYREKLRDFQNLYKGSQDELKIKDRQLTGRILEELREIVEQIGKQGNYTVILEGNNTVVLYGAKAIDLTDSVIKSYNQKGSKVSYGPITGNRTASR